MSSPKQIAASRTNGCRSKGPVTPKGKYNSSRNNTRHGLLAQTVVLEAESEQRFLALLNDYMQAHQPRSATEAALVETMVVARWRLLRVWGFQKLAMDRDIALQDPATGPPSVRAMFAVCGSPDSPPKPDVLLRYENSFDRQFSRALRLLEIQSRRNKSASEPYFPAESSGHNWKSGGCGADLPVGPEPDDAERETEGARKEQQIAATIRTQEVAQNNAPVEKHPQPAKPAARSRKRQGGSSPAG